MPRGGSSADEATLRGRGVHAKLGALIPHADARAAAFPGGA